MNPRPPRTLNLFDQQIRVFYWDHDKGTIEIPAHEEGAFFGVFVSDAAGGESGDVSVEKSRVKAVTERLLAMKAGSVTFMGRRADHYEDMFDWDVIDYNEAHNLPEEYFCSTMSETGDPAREFVR
jgi:hypothetical protein